MGLFGKSKEQKIREEAEHQLLLEEAKRKIKEEGEARLAAKKKAAEEKERMLAEAKARKAAKAEAKRRKQEEFKKWEAENPKSAKILNRSLILLFCLFIGGCGLLVHNMPQSSESQNQETQKSEQKAAEKPDNQFQKLNKNLSQAEAESIQDTLNQCGMAGQAAKFETVANDDTRFPDCNLYKGFIRQNNSDYDVTVYTKNDKVVYILAFIDGGERELYADGKVTNTFDDFILSNDEATKYIVQTQNIVKSVLLDPDSADFPWAGGNNWNMHKNPEHIRISSYVKSENAFGKKIKTEFSVTYSKGGAPISVIINGKEYLKK